MAEKTQPHLVILDVRMPYLDGIAVAEALLAANPAVELIAHTSEPDSERLREAEPLGIHVNDQADPDGLLRQVAVVAGRVRRAAARERATALRSEAEALRKQARQQQRRAANTLERTRDQDDPPST